jgi:hypothetical protein
MIDLSKGINIEQEIREQKQETKQKRLYWLQRICKSTKKNGSACKGIAITGSEYCRFHSNLPSIKRLQKDFYSHPERYKLPTTFQEYLYKKNLNQPTIFNLSNEVALLQTYLQVLIDDGKKQKKEASPSDNSGTQSIPNLALQLIIVDKLGRLTETLKRIEAQDKYFNQARQTIGVVLQRIVIIMDKYIPDKNLKSLIAQELYKVGLDEEQGKKDKQELIEGVLKRAERENEALTLKPEAEIGNRGDGLS